MNRPSLAVATRSDDSGITASVKAALLADAEMGVFEFKVETRKGRVGLTGFVESQSQIERAISVTRSVAGVRGIKVTIRPRSPTVLGKM